MEDKINSRYSKSNRSPNYMYNCPTYITLSDFMRIKNEINPIIVEYENRKAYKEKLKNNPNLDPRIGWIV